MNIEAIMQKSIKLLLWMNFFVAIYLGVIISTDLYGYNRMNVRHEEALLYNMTFTSDQPEYDLPTNASRLMTNYTTIGQANITRYYINTGPTNITRVPVLNVAFLKVHKAGSTTMQNLLFRFGLRHKLNILVPKKGNYLYRMVGAVPLKSPNSTYNNTYNIFACHSRYSKKLFDQFVPTDSVKIAIVREPVDRIVSAAFYYRDVWHSPHLTIVPKNNFIHNLLHFPEKYDKVLYSKTRNAMGYDFGFSKRIQPRDKKRINSYLRRLNSEFKLVMVVERFNESLVMLKRYLSWSFLDIIYLKANSHKHNDVVLNKREQAIVRETNFLDFAIYEYFTKVFEDKLHTMGDDFSEEVKYFTLLLQDVHAFCSKRGLKSDSKLLVNQTIWDSGFTVLGKECSWLKTREIQFIKIIRDKTLAM